MFLDLLGFGFSSKPRRHKYSVLEQADIIAALLASLEIQSLHILAHDLGDSIAQECLARNKSAHPEAAYTIRSVCFLNGGLFPEAYRPRLIQTLLRGPLGPILVHGLSEKKFNQSFAAVFGANTQPSTEELSDFWHLVALDKGQKLAHRLLQYIPERRLMPSIAMSATAWGSFSPASVICQTASTPGRLICCICSQVGFSSMPLSPKFFTA